MLSIDIMKPGFLEKNSEPFKRVYWETDAVIKFKQKLLQAHKFVIGDEFLYYMDAFRKFTEGNARGIKTLTDEGFSEMEKHYHGFFSDEKRMKRNKAVWKEFCCKLPFPIIFFESTQYGYLLEELENGEIHIYQVKADGVLSANKIVLSPHLIDVEDTNQSLTGIIATNIFIEFVRAYDGEQALESFKMLSMIIGIQCYQLLTFVNCRNINIVKYKPKKSELAKLPKVLHKGYEYHVVKISNDVTRYESLEDLQTDVAKSVSSEMKAHVVRGHFKKRATGVFWWNSFLRGHRKNGVIEKHYELI